MFYIRGVHKADYGMLFDMFKLDVYRLDLLKEARVIVDVGAHIGLFACTVAKMFPNARVYAIEPSRDNFAMLERNIVLNGLTNVTAMNRAVSDESGTVRLFLNPVETGNHSIIKQESDMFEEVQAIAFHDLPQCDVLKIDAEGIEYRLLRDTIPMCRYIGIEIDDVPGEDRKTLVERIEHAGYRKIPTSPTAFVFLK